MLPLLLFVATTTVAPSAPAEPVSCGEVVGRCPPDLEGTTALHQQACALFTEAVQWKCRADSAAAEADAEHDRAEKLAQRVREIAPQPAPTPGISPAKALLLLMASVGGAAAGGAVSIDDPKLDAAAACGGAVLGASLMFLAFSLFE